MKKIILILLLSFVSLFAFEELNSNNFDNTIQDKNAVVVFHQVW